MRARSFCLFVPAICVLFGTVISIFAIAVAASCSHIHAARTFPFRRVLISLIKEFTYRKNSRMCVSKNFRKTYFFFLKKTQIFEKSSWLFCPSTVFNPVCFVVYLFVGFIRCVFVIYLAHVRAECLNCYTHTHTFHSLEPFWNIVNIPLVMLEVEDRTATHDKEKLTNYGIWQTMFFIASHLFHSNTFPFQFPLNFACYSTECVASSNPIRAAKNGKINRFLKSHFNLLRFCFHTQLINVCASVCECVVVFCFR